MFQGVDTPGVGSYDPLKETFEDKRKKKVMRRLNMYNQVSKSIGVSMQEIHY